MRHHEITLENNFAQFFPQWGVHTIAYVKVLIIKWTVKNKTKQNSTI